MFLVIGTVTADLLVTSRTPLANLGGDGFRSSNLVFTDEPLAISMGGNGGNSAYVLAGLGVSTALIGAVGQDLLGDALVGWLQEKGVNVAGVLRTGTHATSSSTIVVSDSTNQVVFHHLGASRQTSDAHLPAEFLAQADVLLATSYPILPRWRAGGFAQALAAVYARGGITALDIGPAIGTPVTLAELAPLLPTVDYLIGNTHELCAATDAIEWQDAAMQLLAAGAHRVVIKQGAQGASLWTATEQVHVPAFPVQANVSVGAGDSFNAGFLYGLHQAWSLKDALRFGNAVAALVVAAPKGIFDAPSLAQVESLYDAQP